VPELTKIAGVGKVKLDRFGDAVLALCRGEPLPAGGVDPA
jgi:hypothetical protein